MINKKTFEFLCKKTQKELKKHLKKQLKNKYDTVISGDGYLFAQGTVPILLVAHMDTVHDTPPIHIVYENGKISSPQGIGGDDRAGCYSVLEIIKRHNCSVLFCEDEEIGMVGAEKFTNEDFVKDLEFNYIIELDRKGKEDAVFYDLDNDDFEMFITKDDEWKTAYGSFSDICTLAPVLGCAAVNLSCGYYNAHTKSEYVDLDELDDCIERTCKIIERTKPEDKFEWKEATRYYGSTYGPRAWDYDDYYGYNSYSGYGDIENTYIIMFRGENGTMDWEDIYAETKYEAVGMFLMDHPDLTYGDIEVECYEYSNSTYRW